MAQTRKMNESFFAQFLKEFNVVGELIRARQDEKQGLLDEFDSECKRFFFGKISEKALVSSVKKTNEELQRLDSEIRRNITRARGLSNRAARLATAQAPIVYRATLSGIVGGNKRKPAKKKVAKKKPVKKKPVAKKSPKKKSARKPAKKRSTRRK